MLRKPIVVTLKGLYRLAVRRKSPPPPPPSKRRQIFEQYLPAWLLLAVVFGMILPDLIVFSIKTIRRGIEAAPGVIVELGEDAGHLVLDVSEDFGNFTINAGVEGIHLAERGIAELGDFFDNSPRSIAPLFTDEIDHWEGDIQRWAKEYSLDPNLLATVMQIESCGHPTVGSSAGAQGLFQVMPFNFATGDDMLDPDTNAKRGAHVLNQCLRLADGDAGMAMACYNGGPSVLSKHYDNWYAETQRYYVWGTGVYNDALNNGKSSDTLNRWLDAGGSVLCDMASNQLALN